MRGNNYESVFELNFSDEKLTDELIRLSIKNPMEFISRVREDSIIYTINSVRELESCWIFRTNLMELCFLPKEKNEGVMKDKFVLWDFFNLTPADYYPHDGNDNKLIFVLSANRWVNGMNTLGELSLDWKKIFSGINVQNDDNQIMLIFKEKLSI